LEIRQGSHELGEWLIRPAGAELLSAAEKFGMAVAQTFIAQTALFNATKNASPKKIPTFAPAISHAFSAYLTAYFIMINF
jgi:hypothetical protein